MGSSPPARSLARSREQHWEYILRTSPFHMKLCDKCRIPKNNTNQLLLVMGSSPPARDHARSGSEDGDYLTGESHSFCRRLISPSYAFFSARLGSEWVSECYVIYPPTCQCAPQRQASEWVSECYVFTIYVYSLWFIPYMSSRSGSALPPSTNIQIYYNSILYYLY